MEVKYVTLSVRRLETPLERMERESKEIALRCIAGAVVALCVAAIALGWYAIVVNRAIIGESKAAAAEPVQVTSKLKIVDTAMVSAETEAQEPVFVQVKNAADLHDETEDVAVTATPMSNPSPLTDSEWAVLVETCEANGVPVEVALAVIETESGFQPDAVGIDGHDFGLFQIRDSNHKWLTDETGYDPMTVDGNIRCGVWLLSYLFDRYDTIEASITSYRWGHDSGDRDYSKTVLRRAEGWATKLT